MGEDVCVHLWVRATSIWQRRRNPLALRGAWPWGRFDFSSWFWLLNSSSWLWLLEIFAWWNLSSFFCDEVAKLYVHGWGGSIEASPSVDLGSQGCAC